MRGGAPLPDKARSTLTVKGVDWGMGLTLTEGFAIPPRKPQPSTGLQGFLAALGVVTVPASGLSAGFGAGVPAGTRAPGPGVTVTGAPGGRGLTGRAAIAAC